jgi:hypothetical protein
MRYRNLPKEWPTWLQINSTVQLKREPENSVDSNAVAVYTNSGQQLGYVPGFYTKGIFSLLENGADPYVRVCYINAQATPHWWVKLSFESPIPAPNEQLLKEWTSVVERAV